MTAPVRAPIPGLRSGATALAPEASRYLDRVRRLRPGDRFIAFDPVARTEADAEMLDAGTATIGPLRPASVVAPRELVLVYALAKGDKVDDVVRDATELGATRVIIARTERSVVKVDDARATAKQQRWTRVAAEAARQCGRGDPPLVSGVLAWSDALESTHMCDARFCLDPHAGDALAPLLVAATIGHASIAFAIGPEGGLTKSEIALAEERGFVAATLGAFVLRTETVAAAVLGAVRILG